MRQAVMHETFADISGARTPKSKSRVSLKKHMPEFFSSWPNFDIFTVGVDVPTPTSTSALHFMVNWIRKGFLEILHVWDLAIEL